MKIHQIGNQTTFNARIKIDKPSKIIKADVSDILGISRDASSLSSSGLSSSTATQSKNCPWQGNQLIDPRKILLGDIKTLKNNIISRHKKIPS